MNLRIGFSPCPNDTFIFDALVQGKIDTGGLAFEPILADVETLNEWALEGKLDITKLSFPAFFRSPDQYVLLQSGSALGKGVGPLLVSRASAQPADDSVNERTIVLPGLHTTAHLLFSFAFPDARHKSFRIFSAIEDAVIKGEADLGVIIHENRFTYQQKGLHKVMDLGAHWEKQLGVPVPLGGIAARRSLSEKVIRQAEGLIRQSLRYAFDRYPSLPPYVREHAQEMDESVMRQHIELYVNDFSLSLQAEGRRAIEKLREIFHQVNGSTPGQTDLRLFTDHW